MWKRRDCAGILQLLNYNLVTWVDHAAHHLPALPSAPSPDPVPHPQPFFAAFLCEGSLISSLENCSYSCCLVLLLLMKMSYRWCQGWSPYESYRHVLCGSHTGNVCCSEESRRGSGKEGMCCSCRDAASWQLWGSITQTEARLSLPGADPFKWETKQRKQRRPSPENYHCPRQEKSTEGIDCISLHRSLIPGQFLGVWLWEFFWTAQGLMLPWTIPIAPCDAQGAARAVTLSQPAVTTCRAPSIASAGTPGWRAGSDGARNPISVRNHKQIPRKTWREVRGCSPKPEALPLDGKL